MNRIQRIHQWNTANPMPHLILRIVLGIILILKGIYFVSHSESLAQLLEQSRFQSWPAFLIFYIITAHLLGGVFITIGLFTRFAAILLIPVLVGAVFFINMGMGTFHPVSELVLSVLVLLLLIYFLKEGSGELSADFYVKERLL